MNLRETILAEHSKANCTWIVKWIGNKQKRFDELVQLFLQDEYIVVQRAGWPFLSEVVIKYPQLVQPHLRKILAYINKPGLHSAVKRNTVRQLQAITIPKNFMAK